MRTIKNVNAIISNIKFKPPRWGGGFRVLEKGDGFLLQLRFNALDVTTNTKTLQSCRKWYISAHATETEIVETAFKACRAAVEHELCEHFLFQGRRIYSPHFHVNTRIRMCDEAEFDQRPEAGL